jgi:hypothetical protein
MSLQPLENRTAEKSMLPRKRRKMGTQQVEINLLQPLTVENFSVDQFFRSLSFDARASDPSDLVFQYYILLIMP